MPSSKSKVLVAIAVVIASLALPSSAGAQASHAIGDFDLSITKSSVLTPGKHHLTAKSATVTYTNEFLGGRVNALKVEMPAADRNSAVFVLLVDRADHITEASLTIIVPGNTVARTVAWTNADLEKYFSDAHYEGGRLRLISRGSYATGADSPAEILTMSWDVDLDEPVVVRAR